MEVIPWSSFGRYSEFKIWTPNSTLILNTISKTNGNEYSF